MFLSPSIRAEKQVFELVDGDSIKAELIGVYTGMVYFDMGRGRTSFVGYAGLSEKSQESVNQWYRDYLDSLVKDPVLAKDSDSSLSSFLQENLVRRGEAGVESYDFSDKAEPEFYAFYYSAHWCGPCRRFTPKLRAFYKAMKSLGHENFEIVFVSSDRSAAMMQTYMEEDEMPWPAVKYNKRTNSLVSKYKGNGIPCLVVTDRYGRLLFHSYRGDEYLGPSVPLKQLSSLLNYTGTLRRELNKGSDGDDVLSQND